MHSTKNQIKIAKKEICLCSANLLFFCTMIIIQNHNQSQPMDITEQRHTDLSSQGDSPVN